MFSLFKKPSAWIPVAMSLSALAMFIFIFAKLSFNPENIVREPDEGVAAHLFQLLMGGQLPIIAFFALKWLPRAPRQTLLVLGVQFIAGVAACFPVYYFNL